MRDPNLIDPHADPYRYEISEDRKNKYLAEPLDKLPQRVNDVADMVRMERRSGDARYAALNKLFRAEKNKNRALMAVLGAAAYKGFEVGAVWLLAFLKAFWGSR